ncbi:MAG: 7-cyano-7-deazaguanine synthase [Candidatus Lokiarchaeota archaeon]|nr:7-cyano-7-deazaguanine synthase [Candidatus Lokiarchaeota archaeon]
MTIKKKIAITGANGYLGMQTIAAALERNIMIHAVIRRSEVIESIKKDGNEVFLVKNFEKNALEAAFKGCESVIHFANIVCGSKELFEAVNIEGLKNIITAAENVGISRIVYSSGLGVDQFGEKDWANNNYFYSKKKAEELLIKSNIAYVIFRPSYILGSNDELIPDLIEQIYEGKVYIAGNGEVPMQPIYVGDAITAFLNASLGKGEDNRIYNLVGLQTINMKRLVEIVWQAIKDIGLNIPPPIYEYISYDSAPAKLEICTEMVDIMKCDIIADGKIAAEALEFKLSPIEDAIKKAVKTKLTSSIKNQHKKSILMLSGGIDSATALYWALSKNYDVIALSMNYKWRPKKEIEATKKLVELTEVPLVEVPIPYIMGAVDLRFEGYPIPSAENAPEGFIPLKNLIFYSIAAYFAEVYGCNFIIGGHNQDDIDKFSDVGLSFFNSLEKIIEISKHDKNLHDIEFIMPLSNKTKGEVFELASKLNVPFEVTWSCYGDFEEPCGRCSSCVSRQKALNLINKN